MQTYENRSQFILLWRERGPKHRDKDCRGRRKNYDRGLRIKIKPRSLAFLVQTLTLHQIMRTGMPNAQLEIVSLLWCNLLHLSPKRQQTSCSCTLCLKYNLGRMILFEQDEFHYLNQYPKRGLLARG
jgi:hypothetical protein